MDNESCHRHNNYSIDSCLLLEGAAFITKDNHRDQVENKVKNGGSFIDLLSTKAGNFVRLAGCIIH